MDSSESFHQASFARTSRWYAVFVSKSLELLFILVCVMEVTVEAISAMLDSLTFDSLAEEPSVSTMIHLLVAMLV